MVAKDKLIKARSGLVLDEPFFGSLTLRLTLEEDTSCKTMWTDGSSLGFNPIFVDSLPMNVLKGVLCHEVMHCALSHHARRDGREKKKWNRAADYAVNFVIREKFSLPEGHLFDPKFLDLSAEEIYSKLPNKSQDDNKNEGNDSNGNDSNGNADPGGCGEVRDAKSETGNKVPSEADLARSEAKWKVAVSQANQQAKAFGKSSAELDRCVDKIINPRLNWHSILQQFVNSVAKSDYSWIQPNRRHIYSGVYLPSCRSPEVGTIVLGVDTSGSISAEALEQVAADLAGILEVIKADCHVVYCDSKVKGIEYFRTGDFILKLNAKGGGGTDFRPIFDWIEKENIYPACMICFTDLDGKFPEVEADYPVLWVTDRREHKTPPFGEVLEVI